MQKQPDILSGQPGDTAEGTTMELPACLKGTTSSVEQQHTAETRLFDLCPTYSKTRKMYGNTGLCGYGFIVLENMSWTTTKDVKQTCRQGYKASYCIYWGTIYVLTVVNDWDANVVLEMILWEHIWFGMCWQRKCFENTLVSESKLKWNASVTLYNQVQPKSFLKLQIEKLTKCRILPRTLYLFLLVPYFDN